jgi:hypothetical protein
MKKLKKNQGLHRLKQLYKRLLYISQKDTCHFDNVDKIINHAPNKVKSLLIVSAINQSLSHADKLCIGKGLETKILREASNDKVIEFILPYSFFRDNVKTDDDGKRIHEIRSEFTIKLIKVLIENDYFIFPVLSFDDFHNLTISKRYKVFSWHSKDIGFKNHFHLKSGSLPGYISIDNQGYSGWASIAGKSIDTLIESVDSDEANQHYTKLYENIVLKKVSKYKQNSDYLDFSAIGQYIFFPLQKPQDKVSQLANIDTIQLLKYLREFSRENKIKIIFKRHPRCNSSEISNLMEEISFDDDFFSTEANIHDIIAHAECVVTVNSTVGVEALLHLKPVIITGSSEYAPACIKATKFEELTECLLNYNKLKKSEEEIKKFLFYYCHHFLVSVDNEQAIRDRLSELL